MCVCGVPELAARRWESVSLESLVEKEEKGGSSCLGPWPFTRSLSLLMT